MVTVEEADAAVGAAVPLVAGAAAAAPVAEAVSSTSAAAAGAAPAVAAGSAPVASPSQVVQYQPQLTTYPGQIGGYPSQMGGFAGQMGGYGQAGGYPGQMGGYPGQQGHPGQFGQPGGPPGEMEAQFNFATAIRGIMEFVAIIQGCSLIGTMAGGWAKEIGSNEEQPLRRFGVWVVGLLRGVVTSLLPFLRSRRRQAGLEDAWASGAAPPPPTRWWVWLGSIYFAASFLQELNAYRRISAAIVQQAGGKESALAGAAGVGATASRGKAARSNAEGDAAGGRAVASDGNSSGLGNMVDFYMQKQREMYQQRNGQLSAPAADDQPGTARSV
eukprot:TRINITY_DN43099_c0_g1_i1.p1 TRINITY_DN43099_c0_g1~~TRINITY_DN43099_c0_g1_i1.p1  ORF type:complete len:359 (+),score=65.26 TRINITY_DN43099_c0_g1_i1:91-1077(+)